MDETLTATYISLIKKADLYFKYFLLKCGGFEKHPELEPLYQELHNFAFHNAKSFDKTSSHKMDEKAVSKYNELFNKSRDLLERFPEKGNLDGEVDQDILEQILQHAVFAGKESYEVVKNPLKYNVTIH